MTLQRALPNDTQACMAVAALWIHHVVYADAPSGV